MKKAVFILIITLLSYSNSVVTAQEKDTIATKESRIQIANPIKHALIIAIGNYPKKRWGVLSSVNDVAIIKQALKTQGFKNIETLIDEQATYQGIKDAFTDLSKRIKPNDIVVIHISSHGQQIVDNNGDEIDGLDEAIIPYDAWPKYIKYKYNGERHLRDDELGDYITQFRNILGKDGQLLLLLDSCHSGTATRGAKVRGTDEIFKAPNEVISSKEEDTRKGGGLFEFDKEKLNINHAPFVLISGASADESNYEYKGQGSLSYAFSHAINQIDYSKPKLSYRQLFSEIKSKMDIIAKRQHPVIEGDIDWQIFGNEELAQEPYFEIRSVEDANLISIQAGKIQGLYNNTTIYLMPKGTVKVKPENVVAHGKIVETWFNESSIELDKSISDLKKGDYWVFINEKSMGDINIDIFIDKKRIKNNFVKKIKAFISEKKLGQISENPELADVIIYRDKNMGIQLTTADGYELYNSEKDRGASNDLDIVKQQIFDYAQSQFLKTVTLNNEDFKFKFRFIPVSYDTVGRKVKGNLDYDDYVNDKGVFQVVPKKDYVKIEVINLSKKTIYFNVLEINSKGALNPLLSICNKTISELKIPPTGEPVNLCTLGFDSPYEKITLKGFATDNPIDFDFLVKSRGNTRGVKRSNLNPFEKFIANSYKKTRGLETLEERPEIDGYSTTFIYEIVKE